MIRSRYARPASLLAAGVALLILSLGVSAQQRRDVGPNSSPLYEKECGSCHFAYQPAWLPERSWRKLMAGLRDHFGDNAELKVTDRDALVTYLVANSADHATSQRAIEMMKAIKPGETPIKVTQVLYVGGIHGGFLDPAFRGEPQVKTLANCSVCHPRADSGSFFAVRYTISDERFRTYEMDYSLSLPVPMWLRIK
jgi:Dihaem cytochrome c